MGKAFEFGSAVEPKNKWDDPDVHKRLMELGKIAYETRIKRCYISLPREGVRIPSWEELTEQLHQQWADIAYEVIKNNLLERPLRLNPQPRSRWELLAVTAAEASSETVNKAEEGFYCVWNDQGKAPSKKHSTRIGAQEEAKRLAFTNQPGNRFYLLQAIEVTYCTKVETTPLREAP